MELSGTNHFLQIPKFHPNGRFSGTLLSDRKSALIGMLCIQHSDDSPKSSQSFADVHCRTLLSKTHSSITFLISQSSLANDRYRLDSRLDSKITVSTGEKLDVAQARVADVYFTLLRSVAAKTLLVINITRPDPQFRKRFVVYCRGKLSVYRPPKVVPNRSPIFFECVFCRSQN